MSSRTSFLERCCWSATQPRFAKLKYHRGKWVRLFPKLPGKTDHANDGAFVQATRNQLPAFAGLDLEIHLSTVHMVNACDAGDFRAQQRWSKMPQFDFHADAALFRVKERVNGLPGGAFQQADQVRRA